MTKSVTISATIITFNEEKKIEHCLQSLHGVADEIIVVDSYSTDSTESICLQYGAIFIRNKFEGYETQKNIAVSHASSDYVLSLDADEYLSNELKASILEVKQNWDADGYTFNRLNHYAGKPIKSCGWYPDAKIRLWDRRRGKWQGGQLHETVLLEPASKVRHIKGDLMHFTSANASDLLKKIQQYSDVYAAINIRKGRVTALTIIYKTLASFIRSYILKKGILDGYTGLVISASNANGTLYKYAKLLEANAGIKASLIITTYNRKDALEMVLLSVLNQTVMPYEVIVADDGSDTDTKDLVHSYAHSFPVPLKHIWHEDDGFRAASIRNKGMAEAQGIYIIFVDGDIVLHRRFIEDHLNAARKGYFIQGSRVLLNEALTSHVIQQKQVAISFFSRGIKNRINTLHSLILSKLFSYKSNNIYKVRSVNISFWLDDAERINGFNEDFTGWGREDSEFAARMHHVGLKRIHLKFAGFGYHLHHESNSKDMLPRNQEILDETLKHRKMLCQNGLNLHHTK